MYRKDSTGWIKHVDFIILDLICLQVAFVLAYALSGYGANPLGTSSSFAVGIVRYGLIHLESFLEDGDYMKMASLQQNL